VKVIVCPLDWGLGHATRCVPIIRELMAQGSAVEIGCCASQKKFFQLEFPGMVLHEAPSYNIRYPEKGWQMPFWLLAELPRLRRVIREEQRWIESLCVERHATHVLSDNRFGCYSRRVPSVYMTHQLRIAFPAPFHIFEALGEFWHARQQAPFREIWVPDVAEYPGLSGKLGHLHGTRDKIRYIGPLSRFQATSTIPDGPKPDILALLSGPEPQRSLFERLLLEALPQLPGQHIMVRGLPGAPPPPDTGTPDLQIVNHLPTPDLQGLVQRSRHIICRPGYSTLMDLAVLGACPILVPTPGQTEQIYLGQTLARQGQAAYLAQTDCTATAIRNACAQKTQHLPQHKINNILLPQAVSHLGQIV
jgi:predicted glycosyltransferase